ncbi:MAG: hypothetical protein KGY50_02075, partial [Candidatus Thermoplasmatota archaeon]|nr:hypothetical protein [Candidatus Thermoplasmatota archaeon]
PFIVLPCYNDKESKKRFRKTRKKLKKVDKIKEDIKKLEKKAKKKDLSGAVAGTLLVAHAEKAPFLAAAKLPTGTVHYAQRGQAPKEYLIAAQHFDDPFYRILGIRDIALKNNLHVYSWDEGFVSTGLTANPPNEFIDFVTNTLDYTKDGNVIHCPHLTKDQVLEKKIIDQPYLHIHWDSAEVDVGICKNCSHKKKNTFFYLTKYLLAEDIADDFLISVVGSIVKDNSLKAEVETKFIDDYLSGDLSDYRFIEKNMNHRREQLAETDQQVYILNGKKYEESDDFIDALGPNEYEKKALQILVSLHQKPIIVSNKTPNDILSDHWDTYGFNILNDILDDEALIDEIMTLSESPSVKVKTAFEIKSKQQVINQLPQYEGLPDIAKYADQLARIFRLQGKQKLFSALRSLPNHPKKRAIAYGMLLSINKQADVKWKFSKIDIESGEFLKPYLIKLLKGKPEEYHESLQHVLTGSGFSESLDEYKKA